MVIVIATCTFVFGLGLGTLIGARAFAVMTRELRRAWTGAAKGRIEALLQEAREVILDRARSVPIDGLPPLPSMHEMKTLLHGMPSYEKEPIIKKWLDQHTARGILPAPNLKAASKDEINQIQGRKTR